MKLRQKLAVVMATAMVVTAVPVITTATTTNSMSMSSVSMVKDGAIGFSVEENKKDGVTTSKTYTAGTLTLDITPKGEYTLEGAGQSFFVKIDNATFSNEAFYAAAEKSQSATPSTTPASVVVSKDGYVIKSDGTKGPEIKEAIKTAVYRSSDGNMTVKKVSDTELEVTVTGTVDSSTTLQVPVFATAKSGDVTLTVDGTDTFVSSGTYVVGTTSNKSLIVTAPEAKAISVEGGTIGDILITEAVKGAAGKTNEKIEIKLPTSSDLEFGSKANIKLVGGRGFAGEAFTGFDLERDVEVNGQTLTIDLSNIAFNNTTATGQISIQGIQVVPEGKTAAKGDVNVTVKNKNIETTTIKVAEVADENITLTCAEPAAIVSGKEEKTVEFTLKENTKEAIIAGRKVDFTIENGFIAVRTAVEKDGKVTYKTAIDTFKDLVASGDIELPTEVSVNDIVAVEANAEGQITGFTVQFNSLKADKASSLKFKMPIMAEINASGDVKLAVEGRAIQNTAEVVIATATAPFTVETEAVELKVGLNGQVGGKITITETAAEMLEKGTVEISMADYAGISFKKGQDLNIKAENVKIKNVKVNTNEITFEVERTSDEAGNIVIDGIEFNVDRTAPEGSFDLSIAGTAISTNVYMKAGLEALTVADFVTIGTKNTEDIATGSNGLKAGTAAFTIGSPKYVVNGVEKTMDGTPYLVEGRTMMPIRYVSEAFGIEGDNILFSKGVVTIFAGNRIVQLTNGSKTALVNGVSYTMDQAVTIKDGRTYIPVGEVGRLLGVKVSWDNEAKTATFTN